jgi:hypothetical protein
VAALIVGLLGAPQGRPGQVPVLVELFTSEGCSSCPPADRVLTVLLKEQPIAGATIIPLGLHVDYWDALGWKDPASLAVATDRQQSYGRRFGDDRIYTPQMVVDGRYEFVGSDANAARKAIEQALKQPHAVLTPRAAIEGTTIVTAVTIAGLPPQAKQPLEAGLAITEDDVSTVVKRGENGGRTLHHDAVVRQLAPLGPVKAAAELTLRVPLRPEWQRDRLNAVFFVQERKTQRIWGAAIVNVK